ncbi:unnamed protein product [marine sediment metagenome]|uniref:Uncharacterized protein n=1 Tax=marine sediment metagenome TaxID=412755 RepID=X1SZQ1_9ZZZZ
MSKAQEQEIYRRITAMHEPGVIARELANATRIQSKTEPIPRGELVAGYFDGNLTWESYYLQPDYFLVLFYDDREAKSPDPYTEPGLEYCQARILKYDRLCTQWHIEARNTKIGNRAFSLLAHRLATE